MVLLFTIIIAATASVPWLFARRLKGAGAVFGVSLIPAFLIVYFCLPTTVGPLFGTVGMTAALFLVIGAILELLIESRSALSFGFIGVTLAAYILTGISNSTMFRARDYADLVPPIEQRLWTVDFQAKDPKHFRVSSPENATFLAGRAIGQATTLDASGQPNAIGSQFTVDDNVSSIQIINHELWTIVPLDWNSWGPQFSGLARGVPGYIKVSGENPVIPAEYVKLPAGSELRYTPGALFGKDLNRLVWRNFPNYYIVDKHLEIDDSGKPFYIVSLAQPYVGWGGEKISGAVIVDPTSGEGADKLVPLGRVPSWVDRVESKDIVHRNIDYHGKFSRGFLNRSIYGSNVLAATDTHFGYGSNDEPVFATGITAQNTSDDKKSPGSLVAVYYTNTRTGKTVEYMLNGGVTEEKAINQCDLLGDVRNRHYHGTTPQLYNVYGHLAYVVPLQNESHAYAGVCIVSVMNVQVIAWGSNAFNAELAFKQVVVSNGAQMSIEGTRKLATITGRVARIGQMQVNNETTFFIQVEGMRHMFSVPVTASQKLPVTKVGDTVWVEYFDSKELVMPVNKFDNKSFELDMSPIEADVQTKAGAQIDAARGRANAGDNVKGVLNKLSPEDRALLDSQMKK